jgi:hypothetical protein
MDRLRDRGRDKSLSRQGGGHQVPSFAPGNPDWIKQGGPLNHDIETAEEFWSFARKFNN